MKEKKPTQFKAGDKAYLISLSGISNCFQLGEIVEIKEVRGDIVDCYGTLKTCPGIPTLQGVRSHCLKKASSRCIPTYKMPQE